MKLKVMSPVFSVISKVIIIIVVVSVFVPGKPFKPSLMFACKTGVCVSDAPFRRPTLG